VPGEQLGVNPIRPEHPGENQSTSNPLNIKIRSPPSSAGIRNGSTNSKSMFIKQKPISNRRKSRKKRSLEESDSREKLIGRERRK
jgi:hypothetical protein